MARLTRFFSAALSALATTAAGFACQGGDLTLPSDQRSFTLRAVSGDGEEGIVGTELGLVVQVTDGAGHPVEDVSIRFEPKTPGAQVKSELDSTNDQGQAETRVHLAAEGTQTVEARLAEVESAVRTSFSLIAVAAEPPGDGEEDDDDNGGDRGRGRGNGNGNGHDGDDDDDEEDDD
jgi:hypothetical protein